MIVALLDIEKAYDMLWREGLLRTISPIGIKGKTYRWIKDFLSKKHYADQSRKSLL